MSPTFEMQKKNHLFLLHYINISQALLIIFFIVLITTGIAAFLALVTEKFRNYTGPMGRISKKKKATGNQTPAAQSQADETMFGASIGVM